MVFLTALAVLVVLYYRKFAFYKHYLQNNFTTKQAQKKRGKCPPCFPNGWYRILSSYELKKGEKKQVQACGREIAIFRGLDGVVYALDAYCEHMGAALSKGKVKWSSCIECPFHGWTYDGRTGTCVQSEKREAKVVTKYQYNDIHNMTKDNGTYIKKVDDKCLSSVPKYELLEENGLVYIWFHSQNKLPHYKIPKLPKLLNTSLEPRVESREYINCHIQEIPENGADWKHFEYVHYYVLKCLYPWIKFVWRPIMRLPTAKDFDETMGKHPDPQVRQFQENLFKQFINNETKEVINCLSVDCYIDFFNLFQLKVANSTVFQIGPGVVFLCFKNALFQMVISMMVTPVDNFLQEVNQKMWTPWWLPYWMSAGFFRGYLKQLHSDHYIWNSKSFKENIYYNTKSDADQTLLNWRNWYSQYYEGCHEYEKNKNALDW